MLLQGQLVCLVFLVPLLLFRLPPPVSAVEEAFCASLSLAHYRTENGNLQPVGFSSIGGPKSMGDHYWFHKVFSSVWAANHMRKSDLSREPSDFLPRLEVYAVKGRRANGGVTRTEEALPGWLHLKLTRGTSARQKTLPMLAVWARTAHGGNFAGVGESIGTFVNVDTECNAGIKKWNANPSRNWLPPASVLPCAGTPVFSPMNPNMAVYVATGGTGHENDRNEIHLLWKLDMSVCDNIREKGFRFMVAIPPDNYKVNAVNLDLTSKLDLGKTHGRVTPNPRPPPRDLTFPKIGPYIFQTEIIKVNWYGAAAPIFDLTSLRCQVSDHDITDAAITRKADWLKDKLAPGLPERGALTNVPEIFNGDNTGSDPTDDSQNQFLRWRCGHLPASTGCPYTSADPWPKENTDAVYKRHTCKPRLQLESGKNTPKSEYRGFWGRCNKEVTDTTTRDTAQPTNTSSPKCPHGDKNVGSTWKFHHDYIKVIRQVQLKKHCDCPDIPELAEVQGAKSRFQVETVQPYDVEGGGCKQIKTTKELDRLGLCKDSVAGKNAAHVRIWHASTMLFTVLVSNSVSSYMARYLKGTISVVPLTGEYRIPLARWYVIHIALVVPTICMYLTCLSSMSKQTDILGYSVDPYAIYHRYFGWAIMGAFIFQVVTGFLRPLNICCRRIAIWIHWGCGEFVYHGAAILCIASYKIPASPFSFVMHMDGNFSNIFYHAAPTIMLVWLVWDLLYHSYTMVYVIRFDRVHDVRMAICAYFPVMLPRVNTGRYRIRANLEMIRREKGLKRLAWGFASMCLLMYVAIVCVLFWWPNLDEHGFGVMQCTHSPDGHFNLGSVNDTALLRQMKNFCPEY